MTEEKVAGLIKVLDAIAADWYMFIGQLGVPSYVADQIKKDCSGERWQCKACLSRGLYYWVSSDDSPTYEKIVAVLDGDVVPNKPLAKWVEELFKGLLCMAYRIIV